MKLNLYTMFVELLKSKIHRTKITHSNLNYVGSIGIDEGLMEAAGLLEWEKVHIYNINNGERFETYAFKEERGSGVISMNGAAARKVAVGDLIIIAAYATMDLEEARTFKPSIIFPDQHNRIK